MDSNCTFRTHTQNLVKNIRKKSWALTKLKSAGLTEQQLLNAYKGLIRLTVEYVVPAWHSLITAQQAAQLEKQQTLALRRIYGHGMSAAKMRQKSGIELLSSRRKKNCLNFAEKNLSNQRCAHWFIKRPAPSYARRLSTSYPEFKEPTARTDRFRNSPRNYLIRLLNESRSS